MGRSGEEENVVSQFDPQALFGAFEKASSLWDQENFDEDALREAEAEIDHLHDLHSPFVFTQEEFRRYLEVTRDAAWDIPSALGSICHHPDVPEFPMHWKYSEKDYQMFPNLAPAFKAEDEAWEILVPHFKEEHHLDLEDPQIDWSFST